MALPGEYRAFLARFGDGDVGPCTFHRLRDAITEESGLPFPLSRPFLGMCAPEVKSEEFGGLVKQWDIISQQKGILWICDYGCAIYGGLVMNGPFREKIWTLTGDAAYYGPFGGSECLVSEFASDDWEPTESPRDYSFFEWYEFWLDTELKRAGLEDA